MKKGGIPTNNRNLRKALANLWGTNARMDHTILYL